jgi:ATP-binding cassette, subfamily B, bacterial
MRARIVLVVVLVLVSGAAVAAGPALVRIAIDDGMSAGDAATLRAAALAYLAIAVAGGIAAGIWTTQMAVVAQSWLYELRHEALAGALRLDLGSFERARRGDVQSRATTDVAALADAASELLPSVTAMSVAVAGGFVAIAVLSPLCALIALLAVPPVALAARWLKRRSDVVYPEYRRRSAVMSGALIETADAAVTLQAYSAERARAGDLRETGATVVESQLAATRMRNRFYPALTLVQATAVAAIVVFAALQALDGAMSVGTAAAVVLALSGMFAPLILLAGMLDQVFAARAALDRVRELARTPHPPAGTAALPERGTLALDGVSFAYLEGRPVLHDVSLAVEPGERVALVGATGAGKSTLAKLATGLADPAAGRVSLGGVDLRDATDRRRLVLIPQETFIVDGTLADNVLLDAPRERIEAAVDALGLRAWVDSLPEGLDTEVGGRLSAGERQLVALLRVVVGDPAAVALDEATSLLDPETEALVSGALARALEGRAVIVIAHRQATADRCDRIAVVRDGRVTGAPARGRPASG